jgi:hypothetical protein
MQKITDHFRILRRADRNQCYLIIMLFFYLLPPRGCDIDLNFICPLEYENWKLTDKLFTELFFI